MTQGPSKTGRRYSGLDADQRTRQRRDAILAAALELFGTNGYAATSVKQICREAALTERYFYESFTDRHACLVALYSDLAQEMSTATTTAIADHCGRRRRPGGRDHQSRTGCFRRIPHCRSAAGSGGAHPGGGRLARP